MKKITVSTVFTYLSVGIAIGAVSITLALLLIIGMTEIMRQIVVWLIASAIMGLVSLVYENENLTDITATLIHAPVTFLTALTSGWILGYGDGSIVLLVSRMLPVIVALYAGIHLLMFLIRRLTLRSLNKRLQK